jgi:hypothetical protein
MQQTQPQPCLVTNPTLISQHFSWKQPIIPLVAKQPRIIPYPPYLMWYNKVPSFVAIDFNMYSMYYSRIKRPNPLIYGKKERYVASITQSKSMSCVEQLEQIQYLVKIPTFGLEQPDLVPKNVHVQ